MKLLTRLAMGLLLRNGATVELRLVKLNDKRPGIQGTRLGAYTDMHAAEQAFQHAVRTRTLDRGSRLTLTLRHVIAETWDPASVQEAANELARERVDALIAKPFVPDSRLGIGVAEIAAGSITSGLAPTTEDVQGVGFANGGAHLCDTDGPLIWEGDTYVPSCSVCKSTAVSKRQGEP